MKRVLLVKMSSLGDVVHALPGVTDAVTALGAGAITFDWVVEEAFAAIPERHPAVANVIPVAWRRWRHDLVDSRGEAAAFLGRLRRQRYDLVLDAQGLMKSAVVTALARGRIKAGLSRRSAREGAASLAYRRQVAVPRERHAIERIRSLFAGALRYSCPAGAPDYGLGDAGALAAPGRPRCVLLHGTTWASKHWPLPFWQALARHAADGGYEVLVPWGNEDERRRARDIAAQAPARVLEPMPLSALMDELGRAAVAVGVDSGLAHLAAALGVPAVVIYGSTSAVLTGCRGRRVRNLQAQFPCAPCMSRVCGYRGPVQTWQGRAVEPACYARIGPETVWRAARELTTGSSHADRLLHL